MTSINEEQLYEKRIAFYRDRTQTCGYRFYDMIQTRRKEMQRLAEHYDNEGAQQQAQAKVLGSVDTYVNCLNGNYNSKELPDYIQAEYIFYNTGLTLSRLSFTLVSLRNTCWRWKGRN